MARLSRLSVAGQPHLVIQAGRAGQPVFLEDDDRRAYLGALLESSRASGVALHAYALVDDGVCLLATPATADALGRFMQRLGRRYVGAFNRRHGKAGSPWAGRYQSAVVDPHSHVLLSMRMIEQAPLRRGLVAQAIDWPWSSAAHHAGRAGNSLVREHEAYWRLGNTPFEREAAYRREIAVALTEAERVALLSAARRGWPIGSARVLAAVGAESRRPVQAQARGRPRRPATAANRD
jgi:putative transposase